MKNGEEIREKVGKAVDFFWAKYRTELINSVIKSIENDIESDKLARLEAIQARIHFLTSPDDSPKKKHKCNQTLQGEELLKQCGYASSEESY